MYLPDLSTFDTNAPRRPERRSRRDGAPTPGTASAGGARSIFVPGEDYGVLQDLVDAAFRRADLASSMDLIMQAQVHDVSPEVMEVVELMPPGTYGREQLCDQMNSIITAHGWGLTFGTVE